MNKKGVVVTVIVSCIALFSINAQFSPSVALRNQNSTKSSDNYYTIDQSQTPPFLGIQKFKELLPKASINSIVKLYIKVLNDSLKNAETDSAANYYNDQIDSVKNYKTNGFLSSYLPNIKDLRGRLENAKTDSVAKYYVDQNLGNKHL